MAVYKRYDQRRRRAVRNFFIWLAVILVIFAATALFGAYLGRRAETAPAPHKRTGTSDLSAEVASPIAEHIVHGEFVTPEALPAFTGGDDPYAHASVWLYKDGAPTFAAAITISCPRRICSQTFRCSAVGGAPNTNVREMSD